MDEDVEMEFISVMGVLVPIELTKGVSCEAKRFAAGDVSSNDEAPEIVEDPIPDTNLNHDVSTNSEHTETKCNHTGCTNFAETQGKGSEPTHCEVAEAKDTTVTIEDKSVDHKNDHVAAVGTQKSCLVGEVEVETGKLKGMAGSTQMTKKSQVKNHNGLRSEVRTQKTREKNRQQERGSKKCRGQEKHRRPNVEPGVIDIKKSKRNPTKDEAKGNSPFDGMKQSTKSCKRKAQTVKTKVAVVQPTNVLESTSDAKEKPTAANSRTTVAVSRSSSIAVSKSKRQVKRPRITEDEASTKLGLLKQRELVSVAGEVRIRNTWKLRSDDEAYDKSSEQTKLRTSTPATNTPSDSTKDTVKMTNSNEQGRCAYPGCTQPARLLTREVSALRTVEELYARRPGALLVHGRRENAMLMAVASFAPTQSVRRVLRPRVNALPTEEALFARKQGATSWLFRTGNALRTVDGLSVHIQDVPTVRISGANARRMTK
ncbi:hypothetical protein PR002_g5746 [Phytophthora rubi]|uniref:Uncharacterized protein n=1 Tax=Phytophthora rubi TaxID=129364 RepID=A0A6A3NCH4_9STRA|nr:hypothetical protein PR002_g5746 [Phytophthora rubi]